MIQTIQENEKMGLKKYYLRGFVKEKLKILFFEGVFGEKIKLLGHFLKTQIMKGMILIIQKNDKMSFFLKKYYERGS